jgi:transposase
MNKKPSLDLEEIKRLYVNEKLSAPNIAKRLMVGNTTIYKILTKLKIKRSDSDSNFLRFNDEIPVINKDELINLYVVEKLNSEQISKKLKISPSTVLRNLKEFGIKIRKFNCGSKLSDEIKNKIVDLYVNKKFTAKEISKNLCCSCSRVSYFLRISNIKRRNPTDYALLKVANIKKIRIDKDGYRIITIPTTHKFACMGVRNGCSKATVLIREHRLVMAEHLGRSLEKWEIVHHKNYNKSDNRSDNLELINRTVDHTAETISHNEMIKMKNQIKKLKKRINKLTYKNRKFEQKVKEEKLLEYLG